jgi:hypothetical protein
MRFVKDISIALVVLGITASVAGAQEYNRFGKGPTTVGLTPPGYSVGGGYMYRPAYRAPAPMMAAAPAENGRRAFSQEPAAAAPSAPEAAPCNNGAPAMATATADDGRRSFSAEPSTMAAPVATAPRVFTAPEYNRFGKGPTTIGLTPPGVR